MDFIQDYSLGVLSSLTLFQTKVSRRVLVAMAFCLVIASMDETLQLFVDGKSWKKNFILIVENVFTL